MFSTLTLTIVANILFYQLFVYLAYVYFINDDNKHYAYYKATILFLYKRHRARKRWIAFNKNYKKP